MNLFTYYRRLLAPAPPIAVVLAACDLYQVPFEEVEQIEGERLSALSKSLWLVTLNQHQKALVVEPDDEQEAPLATEWVEDSL